MTRLGSFKSQSPSSREVPSPKVQRAAPRALVWSLRFEGSLELGALVRAVFHRNSEELQTNREPLDGSQTPFDTLLQKKKNPLYTGLIERITSTTFTRRMVGSCEPLSYARVGHLPVFTIAFKFSLLDPNTVYPRQRSM